MNRWDKHPDDWDPWTVLVALLYTILVIAVTVLAGIGLIDSLGR